jgi:hypothetical protein
MLNEASLSARSRQLALVVFNAFPGWKVFAKSELRAGNHEGDLLVEVPSPTGDKARQLSVWIDEGGEPSIGFGWWHTHASLFGCSREDEANAIVLMLKAIVADEFVITHEGGLPEDSDPWGVLDLREQDALEEALTSKYAGHALRILSWTGAADRTITLNDLNR